MRVLNMEKQGKNATSTEDPAHLVQTIYGHLLQPLSDPQDEAKRVQQLMTRAILAPRNKDVSLLNERITARLAGEAKAYYSADDIGVEPDANLYPVEHLDHITPQGLPPHKLSLKTGMPIILLRNLCPAAGLANACAS
jgi:hypothetical protein